MKEKQKKKCPLSMNAYCQLEKCQLWDIRRRQCQIGFPRDVADEVLLVLKQLSQQIEHKEPVTTLEAVEITPKKKPSKSNIRKK